MMKVRRKRNKRHFPLAISKSGIQMIILVYSQHGAQYIEKQKVAPQ